MASRGSGSQKKGSDFERKIARKLKEVFGVDVKRTGTQERWKAHGGDVNPPSYSNTILKDFFWECKNRENWAILNWFKKAQDDSSKSGQIPVVVASKNHEDDYAFLRFEDFIDIIKELEEYKKKERL